MQVQEIISLLDGPEPCPMPDGWQQWPEVAEAHRQMARRFLELLPEYPGGCAGCGIVICAGGSRLFTCGYVCARMLRFVGCRLPIQFWHLGDREMDEQMRRIAADLGVACIDAEKVRAEHPARILKGWELKAYAMVHAPFREVLLLDADNVPVADPTYLFESEEYGKHGAIFWPDFGRLDRRRLIWDICEVPYRDEPEIESGQIFLDKERCWRALRLALWLNEHSDYYYAHIHGDKCTFQMAWHMLNQPYAMPSTPIEALDATMCQHDFQGRRLFQHRNMDKWRLDGSNRAIGGLLYEEQCREFLAELRSQWSGVVGPPVRTDAAHERALARAIDRCLKTCEYQPALRPNQETLARKYRVLWALSRTLRPRSIATLGDLDAHSAAAFQDGGTGEHFVWAVSDGVPEAELVYINGACDYSSSRARTELGLAARPRWICLDRYRSSDGVLAAGVEFCKKWSPLIRATVTLDYCDGGALLIELAPIPDEAVSNLAAEQRLESELTGSRFVYRRVGYDERPMELQSRQRVGEGAAGCELAWRVDLDRDGTPILTLAGEKGPTCHLRLDTPSGIWKGRWLHYERMPVEMAPAGAASPQWIAHAQGSA